MASSPGAGGAGRRPGKHSLTLSGHRTSVSLEPEFWAALKEIAGAEGTSLAALVDDIDRARGERGLSAALRVFVLAYYRRRAGPGERQSP